MAKYLPLFIVFALLLQLNFSFASGPEIKSYTVSGYVHDKASGEFLTGVSIYCSELKIGTLSNAYGFYSLSLPLGKHALQYSYVGYKTHNQDFDLNSNTTFNVNLEPTHADLSEVVIIGKRMDENVKRPEMSIVKLDIKSINRVPALLGEIDLIKVIQLLPGVLTTSEGSTGFSVRGGSSDQNLILLDEAPIHNASHLMGFFSIFNNDAVKDVTLYKGDVPVAYGGRLSSLLDVRTKDGNSNRHSFKGSIGTVSSKLTIEGPIIKNRTTYLISGRRTYADLFLPFAKQQAVRDSRLYFYDLNMKLTHEINENNRFYISAYSGRDTFKNQFASMGFGNQTATIRWNHLFSTKLFFNLTGYYTQYKYQLGTPEGDASAFRWTSSMKDFALRFDFTYFLTPNHTLRYGATSTIHTFYPGTADGLGAGSAVTTFVLPNQYALEHSLYAGEEFKINPKLNVKYGFRFVLFQNIGPGTYFQFDSAYNPIDSLVYTKSKIFNTYSAIEPRIACNYMIDDKSSIKGSYSFNKQFLTLAQNSTAGTPLDIWFPASPNVKPQSCNQVAIGYFRNLKSNMYEVSAEIYYKKFNDVIDFRDHANLLLNQYLEGELRIGKGESYGIETLIRKNEGKLNGWLSYTYSRSFRTIPAINNGNKYPAPYDKPHTVNLVLNYEISKKLIVSATWVYATGIPVTFPTGRAFIGNVVIPIYSDRNAYRMPDYHRLDLSITLETKQRKNKRWQGEWNFSVYNAYNRHNAWSINFTQDHLNPYVTYAEKSYLFSVIPAITYNFKF